MALTERELKEFKELLKKASNDDMQKMSKIIGEVLLDKKHSMSKSIEKIERATDKKKKRFGFF